MLLRELRLFLSVLPVPSQDLAQRENQEVFVASLPTRTPWRQEMPQESLQGLKCQAKERGFVRFSFMNNLGGWDPLTWGKEE